MKCSQSIESAYGVTDYTTAVRNATRRLTDSGLQFVDYESGAVAHADVAARRAVLTGLAQMTGKISEHNAAELDTDIVEVTAHAGARPDHAEWQGRWYSLSGKSKKYRSLAAATGYGTGAGLKGWNCRHDFYPVIDGISEPAYTEEELKNIDPPPFEYNGKTYTYYEATQRQRYMERSMRKTKRELLAADSTGDEDRFTEKSVLLRRQREDYSKFSKAAGLLTQNERTQVYGFGHSEASKAAWAAKKDTHDFYNDIQKLLGNKLSYSLDEFEKIRYNKTNKYTALVKSYSEIVSHSDFKDIVHLKGKMSDYNVRKWYLAHDGTIPDLIDKSMPIEDQARQACELRNTFRTQARDLMKDQNKRRELDQTDPNKSFEELVKSKMERKNMTREEAVSDVLKTSTKTRSSINKKFGLED